MKPILKQLYEGILDPSLAFIHDPNYGPTWGKIGEEVDYLTQQLSSEAAEHLHRMEDLVSDAVLIESYESFSYGFRLGMSLLWEVVSTDR